MEKNELKELKDAALNTISPQNYTNPYDRWTGEASYWTMRDCVSLIESATCIEHIDLALKIFNRYKFNLIKKK